MCLHLLASRSNNTVTKYHAAFKRWSTFCHQNSFPDMPAQPMHVAVYLTNLLEGGSSHSVVSAAIYGIKWAHDINGLTDPTDNAFVRNLHESAKRSIGHKVIKKDVVTANMITELGDKYVDSNDPIEIRTLCMITTAFAGFLRYDELSSIRCNDVMIHPDYFTINIKKSKTDQFRAGNEVIIAKGSTSSCPHSMLLRYMSITGITIIFCSSLLTDRRIHANLFPRISL